jgi:hypothetical protein
MSRSNQFSVSVTVDDRPLGIWDVLDGGAVTSEETKYRPGGMAAQLSLGGSVTTENITVKRLYTLARDHAQIHWLLSRVGKGRVVAVKTSLDTDGNVFGAPLVYSGTLMSVTPPPADSESDDPALVEMEISTDGTVA